MRNQIQKVRQEKGISRDKLSALTGISTSSLYQIEKGRQTPSIDKVIKIAKALNVTIEELFESNYVKQKV